jgi:hypothetical protein
LIDADYLKVILPGVLGQLQNQNRKQLYFNDPVLWAHDVLGVRLWERQENIARAVVDYKNVAVKAGHEVGKSYLAGILIAWWVDTRWNLPGGCFVVSTAPSTKQINAVVWREIRRFYSVSQRRYEEYKRRIADGRELGEYAYSDHALPGYITSDAHWKLPDGIELGYGSKPPDAKEDTMSGIHARYVLAVGDEAVGLSESLINDLQNITSNATSRRFIIMNPTNPLSYAGKIFKQNTGTWHLETISVLDSPNFHGGKGAPPTEKTRPCDPSCPNWDTHKDLPPGLGFPVEVLETLVDHSYVDDKIRDYGKDHPEYISRVLGEFAWDAGPSLISPEELAIALDVELIPSDDHLPVMGVDVSRSDKGDMNAAYICRRGNVVNEDELVPGESIRYVDSWNDRNAMNTAKRINRLALENNVGIVYIDGSGLGGPIADRVRELSNGRYHCWDAIGGKPAPPEEANRYYNARAWWYSELRRKIASGLLDIDIDDTKLTEELLGVQTKFPASGVARMLIESKQDMRKRGVGSPDFADAAMYSQINTDHPWNNPFAPQPGQKFVLDLDMDEEYASDRMGGYSSPI